MMHTTTRKVGRAASRGTRCGHIARARRFFGIWNLALLYFGVFTPKYSADEINHGSPFPYLVIGRAIPHLFCSTKFARAVMRGPRYGRESAKEQSVSSDSSFEPKPDDAKEASLSYFVRVKEAASITGLSASLIRKTFIAEIKRPKNVPPPPPHKRIGKAVYIIRDQLPAWVEALGDAPSASETTRLRGGRPTVADRIKRRPANDNGSLDSLAPVKRSSGKTRR
jgi:hypothetical protein